MVLLTITGCLGFMGSQFTYDCLNRGWHVFGVDKMTYAANSDCLKDFLTYDKFHFIKKDICDLTSLPDCDYVVNFAAESHVANSIQDNSSFLHSNVIGVSNLLNILSKMEGNSTDKPLLIHISTDEVYGDSLTSLGFTEKSLLNPSNPYSASKASADLLILAHARTFGVKYIILRPTNNYGERQYPEKLIPLSVKRLMQGKLIKLHNNGVPLRTWLHSEDTSRAIFKVIEAKVQNKIYNISGDTEQTNAKTVQKIIKAFHGSATKWHTFVDFSFSRQGQDVRYLINDRALRALGWAPEKTFDDEIEVLVEFYKKNTVWFSR